MDVARLLANRLVLSLVERRDAGVVRNLLLATGSYPGSPPSTSSQVRLRLPAVPSRSCRQRLEVSDLHRTGPPRALTTDPDQTEGCAHYPGGPNALHASVASRLVRLVARFSSGSASATSTFEACNRHTARYVPNCLFARLVGTLSLRCFSSISSPRPTSVRPASMSNQNQATVGSAVRSLEGRLRASTSALRT